MTERRIYRNEILGILRESEGEPVAAWKIAELLDLSEYQVKTSIANMIGTDYAVIEQVSPGVFMVPAGGIPKEVSTEKLYREIGRDNSLIILKGPDNKIYMATMARWVIDE